MCGIAGITGVELKIENINQSLASMAHRGPDSRGYFCDEKTHLFHTRLSIQDLTENGNQPMFSADKRYLIVYNGELYNHDEIRKALAEKGQRFASHSDTETLLYGYLHYGKEILQMLNGIFAFAIYDTQQKTLFAGRDASGVKPFYYTLQNDVFSFASEIKTLLSLSEIDRRINENALFQTLMLQWQMGANTGFSSVNKLLPGHCIELDCADPKSLRVEKWSVENFNGTYENLTEAQWIEKLDSALNHAVQRQQLSDKPIAYFLSGGLDSSLLLAIAHKIAPAKTIKAYTINPGNAFSKEGFSADLPYAKLVARHLKIDLHIIETSVHFLDDFDEMIYHLDEAQADIAPLFVQQISKAAKAEGYDVLIGGVGGDDVFSGYRRHQALAYESQIEKAPLLLRKMAKQIVSILPLNSGTRRLKKLAKTLDQTGIDRIIQYFFWTDKKTVKNLFTEDFLSKIDTENIEHNFQKILSEIPEEANQLNQLLQLEMKSFLPCHNLNYTDKMGMAEGVEIRVPYLDKEIIELAAKIPPELKMRGTETKYLLKKVAEKYLPKEVIYRSKTGFGAPIRSWMQEDKVFQNTVWERLSRPDFIRRNIFKQEAIEQLFQDTINKKRDNSYTLLSLLAIESWLRQFAP